MRAALCLMWALTYLVTSAHAKTHTWWYESTEVKANPDGTYERIVHGFNNTWPLPTLRVKKGDTVNFYLINGFDDRTLPFQTRLVPTGIIRILVDNIWTV